MTAIFFYGSLMEPQIRRNVFADSISEDQIRNARAEGFCTMSYPGESYPVLVRAPGSVVSGQLLLEPCTEALERMAFYEGSEYRLEPLEVITDDGDTLQALYNMVDEHGLALDQPWSYDNWQVREREALIETSRLYMQRCWGRMSMEEAHHIWVELHARHLGLD